MLQVLGSPSHFLAQKFSGAGPAAAENWDLGSVIEELTSLDRLSWDYLLSGTRSSFISQELVKKLEIGIVWS